MPYKVLTRDDLGGIAARRGEVMMGANYWKGLQVALNAMEEDGYLYHSREGDKQDLFVFYRAEPEPDPQPPKPGWWNN